MLIKFKFNFLVNVKNNNNTRLGPNKTWMISNPLTTKFFHYSLYLTYLIKITVTEIRGSVAEPEQCDELEGMSGDDEFDELAEEVIDDDEIRRAGKGPDATDANLPARLDEPGPAKTGFRATIFLPFGPVTTMI